MDKDNILALLMGSRTDMSATKAIHKYLGALVLKNGGTVTLTKEDIRAYEHKEIDGFFCDVDKNTDDSIVFKIKSEQEMAIARAAKEAERNI